MEPRTPRSRPARRCITTGAGTALRGHPAVGAPQRERWRHRRPPRRPTTGTSTTSNTAAPNGGPNGVSAGSLETYGVTSCDMFPAGGATTFANNTLIGPDSDVQTRRYDLSILARVAAEVPTDCGYAGSAS